MSGTRQVSPAARKDPHTKKGSTIEFHLPPDVVLLLKNFPWNYPLGSWEERGVHVLQVKSGLSRHVVRFVEARGRRFAVKETSPEVAGREFENYAALRRLEIPTLVPIGSVERHEGTIVVRTKVGRQRLEQSTGYLVTELMEKVIPDSYLFRRGFSRENRTRIWDAVVRLFIQLHSHGVYWGDASLANMLIKFTTEVVPELGHRTQLSAVLGDAETVEIRQSISDALRKADVELFLESMLWTEADLRASGIVRDPLVTQEDQQYILTSYKDRFTIEQEMQSFEIVTHIDVDKLLGAFDVKGRGKLLLQHIKEHKWYLSERKRTEVPLYEAAEDWYREVFKPVCRIFHQYGLLKYFPDDTASALYVEIMEHKYFMSEREKRDVGLVVALEDYLNRYATQDSLRRSIESIIEAVTSLFRRHLPPDSIYLS
jgi:hypothetical protein